jgi:Flp pilus assembly protein TadG
MNRIRSTPPCRAGLWSLADQWPARACLAAIRPILMAKAAGFYEDRRGAAAILFALSMPMLIGGLGLGFEVSNWYLKQRGMQNAADAAVLAATSNGGSNYDVEARAVAAQYGFATGVAVANNVACPGGGNTCYGVTISSSVPLYLSPAVGYSGNGNGQQNLAASATATQKIIQRPYCVLALAGSGAQGIKTNGAPTANLAGCSVKSNTSAVCTGHNLGATYGDAVGTSSGCGTKQNSGVSPSVDLYAGLASNIPADTCAGSYPQVPKNGALLPASNLWAGNKNWSGNVVVCGDQQLTGNVTVNAPSGAVLVIENGQLDTHGFTFQTSSGSALTVVFSGSIGGSYIHAPTNTSAGPTGTLDIAAPTSGLWSGIAIYQDPKLTSGVDIAAAGNAPTWDITGLIYLPHSTVTLSGAINKSTNGQSCIALVVDNITIKGTGDILPKGQCPTAGLNMPSGAIASRGVLVQ